MSTGYKIVEQDALHYVTLQVVKWIDVFTRKVYRVQDYHWYRQDKGGFWSQKHGSGLVTNVDGSNHLIRNPAIVNHNYGTYPGYGTLNYNGGGIFLWVRRR